LIAWEMDALTRRFTRVSGRVEAVFGYPPDRWRSLPGFWIGILHPEDRRRVAQAVNRVLSDREPCEIEYRAVASDGAVVRIRDQVRVITDGAGLPRLLQGRMVLHDRPRPEPPDPLPHVRRTRRGHGRLDPAPWPGPIFARRETPPSAADQPPAGEEKPEPVEPGRLLASLGQAVVASDTEHRVTFWNAAAERLFGWTAVEAIGRTDSELVPARADARQNAEILSALIHGRPWSTEVEARTRDGATVPVLVSASAVTRPDGSNGGFVALITDLREVRRGTEIETRNATLDAVARLGRTAGRELFALAEQIDRLAQRAVDRSHGVPGIADDLAMIQLAADQAVSLALELRDMGRDRDTSIRPADLGDLLRRNVPALELLTSADVHMTTHLEAAPRAWLDSVAVSQALFHLAADAVEAMPAGGRLEISVLPAEVFARRAALIGVPAGQYTTLEIRDTRNVFEPTDPGRWFDLAAAPETHPLRRSAAHGLVRACGAWITAERAEDDRNGLIIRVYFRTVRNDSST
jgi:PAS domain S-box-containing protein